jgi:putative hydrolase of the HAD superfamily
MFKLILFDLGGVVFTDGKQLFAEKLAGKYGVNQEAVKKALTDKSAYLYRKGKITKKEFWENFLKKLKIKARINNLETSWASCYQLRPEIVGLIKKLKVHFKVFYLSENTRERVIRLDKKYHFLSLFDGGLFSFDILRRKTETEFYLKLKAITKTDFAEMLFIDDKIENLKTAEALGIKTVLFTSVKDLQVAIEKLFKNFP